VPEDARLRPTQCLTYHGWMLGLVHDVLDPEEMPTWPIERTMQHYFGQPTDMIICGHTHVERICRYERVWVINPGSPTYPHNLAAQPGTVGILTLEDDERASVVIYDLKALAPLPGLSQVLYRA